MIAGYSFGCWVGLRAVSEDTRVRLLIGISPPCNEYDFSFLTQEFRPKFLVVGDGDFVCATDKFDELMAKLPEPKTGPVLAGIDHFHVGTERRFIDELNTFLDRHPF
jgi:alpha/beta superfamily hydrolase